MPIDFCRTVWLLRFTNLALWSSVFILLTLLTAPRLLRFFDLAGHSRIHIMNLFVSIVRKCPKGWFTATAFTKLAFWFVSCLCLQFECTSSIFDHSLTFSYSNPGLLFPNRRSSAWAHLGLVFAFAVARLAALSTFRISLSESSYL